MPLPPGSKLGDYEIRRPLGAGGMGEVYLAQDVKLGRSVAIKVLSGQVASDPARIRRFEQEARAASALTHPNVCAVHALGETADGHPFIAMEYIEGQTLRHLLQTQPPTLRPRWTSRFKSLRVQAPRTRSGSSIATSNPRT